MKIACWLVPLLLLNSCFSSRRFTLPKFNSGMCVTVSLNASEKKKLRITGNSGFDNAYLKFPLAFCEEFGSSDYRPEDVKFYDLDPEKKMACILYVMDLECGCPTGSAGSLIEVYRKEHNIYKRVYWSMGTNVQLSKVLTNGIRSFTYTTRENVICEVIDSGGSLLTEIVLSMNGIAYMELSRLAIATGLDKSVFHLPELSGKSGFGAVRISKRRIGSNRIAEFYSIDLGVNKVFLFENGKILLRVDDTEGIKVSRDETNGYFDLVVENSHDYRVKNGKIIEVPSRYVFDSRDNRYVKQD